jgi:5-methylcytosine-specific restriction endonuclease McrA
MWKHGTNNGYSNKNCRCDKCRQAHTETERIYRAAHPEKDIVRSRRWRLGHPEKAKEVSARYRKNHIEEKRASHAKHVKENPESWKIWRESHRARKMNAPGTFTVKEWKAMLLEHDHRCCYCLEKSDKLTQDHVIPLTQGGRNDSSNIVPACRSCNAKKGTKSLLSFLIGKSRSI